MVETEYFTLEDGVCRIREGVARIRVDCFEGYKEKLTKLCIPKSVKIIMGQAFENCNKLVEFEVAETNTKFRVENGCLMGSDGTLVRVPKGGQIDIPAGVTKIGDYAFYQIGMRSVVLPPTVTEIGRYAFAYSWPLECVDPLPEGLTTIKEFAFRFCALKEITIPESVRFLGNGVFDENNGLRLDLRCRRFQCGWLVPYPDEAREKIRILLPRHLSISGELTKNMRPAAILGFAELYAKGEEMEEDLRSDGLRYIRNRRKQLYGLALEDENLMQLMLAEKIIPKEDLSKVLDQAVQQQKTALTAALLEYQQKHFKPSDPVKEMQKQLKVLETGKIPVSEIKKSWNYVKLKDGTLRITGYKGTQTDVAVPDKIGKAAVTVLGEHALSPASSRLTREQENSRRSLCSLTVPEGVKNIEYGACSGCINLANVKLPDHLTQIGGIAFRNCASLTQIELPGQLTNIEGGAFQGCTGLTQIVLPTHLTHLGESAFAGCTQLTHVRLPDGLTGINPRCFAQCAKLEEISLPRSVQFLSSHAFMDCQSLETIALPEGLTSIYDQCFAGCTSLSQVNLPSTLENIGEKAFQGTPWLKAQGEWIAVGSRLLLHQGKASKLSVPEGVEAIGADCFCGHESLTEITLPSSLKKIGDGAFAGCNHLVQLVTPEHVELLDLITFFRCPRLQKLTVLGKETELRLSNLLIQCPDVKIFAPEGSKAQSFALREQIPFQAL